MSTKSFTLFLEICKEVSVKLNGLDEMPGSLFTSVYRTEICCASVHILIFWNKAFHLMSEWLIARLTGVGKAE